LSAGNWLAVVMATAREGQFAALSALEAQATCLALTVVLAGVFVLRSSSFRVLGGAG
jgi:hypothetical protein